MKCFPRTYFYILTAMVFLTVSCGKAEKEKPAEIVQSARKGTTGLVSFHPMSNWLLGKGNEKLNPGDLKQRYITLDYHKAVEGFRIPSIRQLPDGQFEFNFRVKNFSAKPQKYLYKIYYQNESYKFTEKAPDDSTKQNPYATENFYGSWEDSALTFKETPAISPNTESTEIKDYFRISGNPRNESRYFAAGINGRWKRNPRVGNYSFLLIITTAEDAEKIPATVKNIRLQDSGHYFNPYFYYIYGDGRNLANTVVAQSVYGLTVAARPDLGKGLFVNVDYLQNSHPEQKKFFCQTCGRDSFIANNAAFQQYFHYVNESMRLHNIPVIQDVIKDNYSLMEYNWNKQFYTEDDLIPSPLPDSKFPCETVISDSKEHKLIIKNPKATTDNLRKENVGIIHRFGLSYGKFRVKAKMPELLNKNGVWNGITNAIWLLNETMDPWNARRPCTKKGYMEHYWGGPDDNRAAKISYSEIDFEILKTVPYCPAQNFPSIYYKGHPDPNNIFAWNPPLPEELMVDNNNISVACTNWDMACPQPRSYGCGCQPMNYQNKTTFESFRWDDNYRAITSKYPASNVELFAGKFYYYEIEWAPASITWRIGPDPEHMRVVGYMNSDLTSIPNNQMNLNITQEFHNTKWWPGTPFQQQNIPFPKNDIIGEIYEVVIE